ncbi:MAG: TetR family transcriptional regulator [Isosphaeraceae bacterium]|jgi:AcrR family transcriptional regulator|nr:MAG: TetR family transcriptional regulator [Isosphaeraceae bacterium]
MGELGTGLDPTRERLLEAAGEEFAAHGFDGATIRAICRRAGANLAAVNYHFGDKERLYYEAVLAAHRCGLPHDPDLSAPPEAGPAERLRIYVRRFLEQVVAVDRSRSWHHDLMLREMIRPSGVCEALTEERIRPRFRRLREIVEELAPGLEQRRLDALCFTVIGQCLFYRMGRSVAERLIGPQAWARLDTEFLADHITRCSLAAVEAWAAPVEAGR